MENVYDLNYSEDALLTRVLFLSSDIKLNVFVEDIDKEYEYEELFERLLPSSIEIGCIFPTGGKLRLEEAYHLFGTTNDYGKTFFIADGDFDLALERDIIIADNFIYLDRYNIESFLIHKETIIKFMRPKLKKTFSETEKTIKYDEWLNCIVPYFEKLFSLHYVVQKNCHEIENVKRGYSRFLLSNGLPKEEEYIKYLNEISTYVPNVENEVYDSIIKLRNIYSTGLFVCGKYYIGSLKLYLNTFLRKKLSDDDIRSALLSGFDLSVLSKLRQKIFSYLVME